MKKQVIVHFIVSTVIACSSTVYLENVRSSSSFNVSFVLSTLRFTVENLDCLALPIVGVLGSLVKLFFDIDLLRELKIDFFALAGAARSPPFPRIA